MNRKRIKSRGGTATVELALCLPLIVLVTLGGMEGASMIFTKQAMVASAYEGIKVAVRPNATPASIEAATQSVLSGRLLEEAVVTVQPANFLDADRGDWITITVSAPGDVNSVFPFGPFQGRQLQVTATMAKE